MSQLLRARDASNITRNLLCTSEGELELKITSADVITISGLTDVATEATLSAMSSKLPSALGEAVMSASFPVVISSNQTAIPISSAVLATDATLSAGFTALANGVDASLKDGQAASANSLSIVLASDHAAIAVSSSSLASESTLSTMDGRVAAMSAKLPATLGQQTSSASMSCVLASDAVVKAGSVSSLMHDAIPVLNASTSGVSVAGARQLCIYGSYTQAAGDSTVTVAVEVSFDNSVWFVSNLNVAIAATSGGAPFCEIFNVNAPYCRLKFTAYSVGSGSSVLLMYLNAV